MAHFRCLRSSRLYTVCRGNPLLSISRLSICLFLKSFPLLHAQPPLPPHSSTSSSSTPPPLSFHSFLLCSFFYIPSSPYCQLLKIISSVYTFLLLPILSFFFHPTPYSSLSFLPSFVSYIHGRASRLSR